MAIRLAEALGEEEGLFLARLQRMAQLTNQGSWKDAESIWLLLDPMDRSRTRIRYLPGEAEYHFARLKFWQGELTQEMLGKAERLADISKSRSITRALHRLRGEWHLDHCEWKLASASLQEALRMARESKVADAEAETGLAIAKFHLEQLSRSSREAERLSQLRKPAHRLLGTLWLALADDERAIKHALIAYHWAWADGEPYVNRFELIKTSASLRQLAAPIPNVEPCSPVKEEKVDWEQTVAAAIGKCCAEAEGVRQAEERLRSLPTAFFGDENLTAAQAQKMTLPQSRIAARGLYKRGDYAKARELLTILLEVGFEMPSTRCHLARVALMTDQLSDADREVAHAWLLRSAAPVYIVPRIIWLRICLSFLKAGETQAPHVGVFIGQLKNALNVNGAFMEWEMEPVPSHIRPKISAGNFDLLATTVSVLNDRAELPCLERLPLWHDQETVPLDTPWPACIR